jgi:hypothetical protein
MQSVQRYKRRAVSERSRVEKETVSKRCSPVKRPSQESQSRVVKGRLKQTAVIREERWTSGVASSRKEDIPARSGIIVISDITVGNAVRIKRSRLSSVSTLITCRGYPDTRQVGVRITC